MTPDVLTAGLDGSKILAKGVEKVCEGRVTPTVAMLATSTALGAIYFGVRVLNHQAEPQPAGEPVALVKQPRFSDLVGLIASTAGFVSAVRFAQKLSGPRL
jgi:hypothetical protein